MSEKEIALVLDGDFLVFSSMAAAEDETDWCATSGR
ncbi:exonuclease [Enterobacter phage 02_vB_Eclo_IJM]|nr:exonuclease [Enterobacter phage 02_vB_Eclo_IJM]